MSPLPVANLVATVYHCIASCGTVPFKRMSSSASAIASSSPGSGSTSETISIFFLFFTLSLIFAIFPVETPPLWVGGWLLRRVGSSVHIDSILWKGRAMPMDVTMSIMAVISLCISCFSVGYMLGRDFSKRK